MRKRDQKRLLQAWLEPKKKWRIFKLAKRYASYFWAQPADIVQMLWEVVSRRDSFGPDEDVFFLAQDALHNLVKDRKKSQEYLRLRHFSHKSTTPLDDFAENEWIDEAGEVFEDENLHATTFPHGEVAVIEKERVEIFREFIGALKELLDPIELAIIQDGEADNYDTTALAKKLRVKRDRIYEARRKIKEKAVALRKRWEAAGRPLPNFPV